MAPLTSAHRSCALFLLAAVHAAAYTPHGFACLTPESSAYPFCDTSLSHEARIASLVGLLTVEEKIGLTGAAFGDSCSVIDGGAPRLGLTNVSQLIEVTGAVSAACYVDPATSISYCPTVFPAPLSLAASFNRTLWREKGRVTGEEARAFNNLHGTRIYSDINFVDLLGFGPDINLVVDPRNGRNGENPSECPTLTGAFAVEVVRGAQEGEDAAHVMLSMGLKHYAVYEWETDRPSADANVSSYDLLDSYLPPYRAGFVEGNAMGSMCSYNAINGWPSCANEWLLTQMVRQFWGRPDSYFLSDCGAIEQQVTAHHTAANVSDATARSVHAGTDGCAGGGFIIMGGLAGALATGELSVKDLDTAVSRLFLQRFKLGMFDPPAASAYTTYGPERIGSVRSRALATDAAAQGSVLLKNTGSVLPLRPTAAWRSIAVVGPHATAQRDLLGDFYGDAFCPGVSNRTFRAAECVPTFGGSVVSTLATLGLSDIAVTVARGVGVNDSDTSGTPAALAAVAAADATVLVVGYSNLLIEHEGADHTFTTLPATQEVFVRAVLAAARGPVILILINAGAIALTPDLQPAVVIESFYPAFGAPAIIDQVFGLSNRWGRLPYTIYDADFPTRYALEDASISTGLGRTYRYFSGTPLWAFGDGETYSTFAPLNCAATSPLTFPTSTPFTFSFSCTSTLTGDSMAGDDVLLAFHSAGADVIARIARAHPVPIKTLRDFARVSLAPGDAPPSVPFGLSQTAFALVNAAGESVLYPGSHTVIVSGFGGREVMFNISLTGAVVTISSPPPPPPRPSRI